MPDPIFYTNAVALDRNAHQGLRLRIQDDHYAFARQTNALPIAASEFGDACRHYPIVFVEGEEQDLHAAALLGLNDQSNLFVSDDGHWQQDTYVPAFARRYPFVLGAMGEEDRLAVCLDEDYGGFNSTEGVALFEDGQESEYLTQMMDFLQAFQREMDTTAQAVKRLKELGLLVARSITVTRDGKDQYLTGFWVVDEDKFNGLDDERVVELFQSGLLRLMELHRVSLGNVQRLAVKLDARQQKSSTEIADDTSQAADTTTAASDDAETEQPIAHN